MAEAFIVAAARTAGGRKGGRLKGWHPVDLGGEVINALLDRLPNLRLDPHEESPQIIGMYERGATAIPVLFG